MGITAKIWIGCLLFGTGAGLTRHWIATEPYHSQIDRSDLSPLARLLTWPEAMNPPYRAYSLFDPALNASNAKQVIGLHSLLAGGAIAIVSVGLLYLLLAPAIQKDRQDQERDTPRLS